MNKFTDNILRGTAEDALKEIDRAKELMEEYLEFEILTEQDITVVEDQDHNLNTDADDLRVFAQMSLKKALMMLQARKE